MLKIHFKKETRHVIYYFLISLFYLLPQHLEAQSKKEYVGGATLKGVVINSKEIFSILDYGDYDGHRHLDTAISTDGSFTFSLKKFYPSPVLFIVQSGKKRNSAVFLLDTGIQNLVIPPTIDSIRITNKLQDQLNLLYADYSIETYVNKTVDFIRKNPASPITPTLIADLLYKNKIEVSQAKEFLQEIPSDYRVGPSIKHLERNILIWTTPRKAQNFSISPNLQLDNLKGKPIILNFWASWCIPCRQETPYLKKLYSQYSNRDLQIVNISIDTDSTKWKQAVIKDKISSWHNLLRTAYIQEQYFAGRELPIPLTYLIDKKGDIVWSTINGDSIENLETKIKEVL